MAKVSGLPEATSCAELQRAASACVEEVEILCHRPGWFYFLEIVFWNTTPKNLFYGVSGHKWSGGLRPTEPHLGIWRSCQYINKEAGFAWRSWKISQQHRTRSISLVEAASVAIFCWGACKGKCLQRPDHFAAHTTFVASWDVPFPLRRLDEQIYSSTFLIRKSMPAI